MGYTIFGVDMGPCSPLFRAKDLLSAFMGYIDLASDAFTTNTYRIDCTDDTKNIPCTYFYVSIIIMCLPSIVVTLIMLCKGTSTKWAFLYGMSYPFWGPWKRMKMMLGNVLICFVDGENDEATRAIADEIALPEIVFESVPQVSYLIVTLDNTLIIFRPRQKIKIY